MVSPPIFNMWILPSWIWTLFGLILSVILPISPAENVTVYMHLVLTWLRSVGTWQLLSVSENCLENQNYQIV